MIQGKGKTGLFLQGGVERQVVGGGGGVWRGRGTRKIGEMLTTGGEW